MTVEDIRYHFCSTSGKTFCGTATQFARAIHSSNLSSVDKILKGETVGGWSLKENFDGKAQSKTKSIKRKVVISVQTLTKDEIYQRKRSQEDACMSEQDFYLLGVDRGYDKPKQWAWYKWQDRINGTSTVEPKKAKRQKKYPKNNQPKKELVFYPKVNSDDASSFAPVAKASAKTLSPSVASRVTIGEDRYDIAF